jgi:uncharacterized protein YkwD
MCALGTAAAIAVTASLGAAPPSAAAARPARLLAPPVACPGQGSATVAAARQVRAVVCLTNFARRRAGLERLRPNRALARSAGRKSADILRCDVFEHEACGRDFTFWMRRFGYLGRGCWHAAENIAFATGRYATPRSIFNGWIHSEGHRANILGPLDDLGVGMRVGRLGPWSQAHVWTQHFGSRC